MDPSHPPGPRPRSGTRPLLGRILVVEDDDGMLEAFRDFLEDAGYTVRCARDGVQALGVLRSERITVVLLDMQLPVMDGHEFRRRQLEEPSLAAVPVVLVTANPKASLDAAVRVLRKPFDADELLRILAELQARDGAGETSSG